MKPILLSNVPIGQKCIVLKLDECADAKNKLMDLGLTEGAAVTPLFESIFKNPRAYSIRGAVIALRREDADLIYVSL